MAALTVNVTFDGRLVIFAGRQMLELRDAAETAAVIAALQAGELIQRQIWAALPLDKQ